MKKLLFFVLLSFVSSNLSARNQQYFIDSNINDQKFLIDGNLYSAKTYCFSMYEGDAVIFLENKDLCISNTIINLKNGNKCDVWCE